MANGIEIYYKQYYLNSNAPNLVMMSGLTRNHQIWGDEIISTLAAKYNVLVFDNRGVGQSSMPKNHYTIETLSDDVIDLLKVLEINDAYLLGHSMGSFAMQYVAYKIPEKIRGVILLSSAMTQSDFSLQYLQKRLITLRDGMTLEAAIRLFAPMLYAKEFLTEELLESIITKEKANSYPQTKESLEMQVLACLNHDSSAICPKIKVPCIIATGALDQITDQKRARILAQTVENSQLEVVPNVGHMLQIEAPDEFCNIVTQFIDNP